MERSNLIIQNCLTYYRCFAFWLSLRLQWYSPITITVKSSLTYFSMPHFSIPQLLVEIHKLAFDGKNQEFKNLYLVYSMPTFWLAYFWDTWLCVSLSLENLIEVHVIDKIPRGFSWRPPGDQGRAHREESKEQTLMVDFINTGEFLYTF